MDIAPGAPGRGIAENLARIQGRVAAAATRAGRDPKAIAVIAVAKRHPAEAVRDACAAGAIDIGESYAQELCAKAEATVDVPAIRWHFIGHLQRNKVKSVVGRASLIHAVDSDRLARAIDDQAAAMGIVQAVLIAVNVGGESQKSGVPPSAAADLFGACQALPHITVRGLMTMPPLARTAADNRAHFAALRRLRDDLASAENPLAELSMGTTDDFEIAVEEGATLVRIGTAIFGPRPPVRVPT
ncbi:MAG TPA: YggS family pyridoxal phosphate-dependent enzyme [Kofleriaceae bacterium]|nr:YggS family pyridoxal phosphate-dependent enzyme [Kofleriaceae bacterium]